LHGLTAKFAAGGGGGGGGSGAGGASQHAYALLQGNVIRHATMLAYIDCFWVLGVVILCLIPAVFLMKKAKPGAAMVH